MNIPWPDEWPHDWPGFATVVAIVIGMWVFALIRQGRVDEKLTKIHGSTSKVEGQVVNNHTDAPGLRDDVDGIKDDVGQLKAASADQGTVLQRIEVVVHGLASELHTIRAELADERKHRLTLGRELRDEFETEVADVRRRFTRRHGGT